MKKPIQQLLICINRTNHLRKMVIAISLACLAISLPASAQASFWHSQGTDNSFTVTNHIEMGTQNYVLGNNVEIWNDPKGTDTCDSWLKSTTSGIKVMKPSHSADYPVDMTATSGASSCQQTFRFGSNDNDKGSGGHGVLHFANGELTSESKTTVQGQVTNWNRHLSSGMSAITVSFTDGTDGNATGMTFASSSSPTKGFTVTNHIGIGMQNGYVLGSNVEIWNNPTGTGTDTCDSWLKSTPSGIKVMKPYSSGYPVDMTATSGASSCQQTFRFGSNDNDKGSGGPQVLLFANGELTSESKAKVQGQVTNWNRHLSSGMSAITVSFTDGTDGNATGMTFTSGSTPSPPIPSIIYPAITTYFDNVGVDSSGCGTPGATFEDFYKTDNTGFNHLELNDESHGKIDSFYGGNYIALNIHNNPIRITQKNGEIYSGDTFFDETNSITQGIMQPYQYEHRPSMNMNSSQWNTLWGKGPKKGGYPAFVGDWNDGLNCGRWVEVDTYNQSGDIWSGTKIRHSDDKGKFIGDGFALNSIITGNVPIAQSYFLVHDSCGDGNTKCRGIDDQVASDTFVAPLKYTHHHIDAHTWSHMQNPDGSAAGTPWYNAGNAYVKWHFLSKDQNPLVAKGQGTENNWTPNIGFFGGTTVYYNPVIFTHLYYGIHGVLYCDKANAKNCAGSWYQAKMAGDGGQRYVLNTLPDILGQKSLTMVGNTLFVRILNADDSEANNGIPYEFSYNKKAPFCYYNAGKHLKKSTECNLTDNGYQVKGVELNAIDYAAASHVQEASNYKTHKVHLTVNTSSATKPYLGFSSAELFSSTISAHSSVNNTDDPLDNGYHGACVQATGATFNCTFDVPDFETATTFNFQAIGNVVDASNRTTQMFKERKIVTKTGVTVKQDNGATSYSGSADGLTVTKTIYEPYVYIQTKLEDSSGSPVKWTPEDSDWLNLTISSNASMPDNAAFELNLPFDNTEPKQVIMFQVDGDGDNSNGAIAMSFLNNGKTEKLNEPTNIPQNDIMLFDRSGETVASDGTVTHGAPQYLTSQDSSASIDFTKGIATNNSKSSPLTFTFKEAPPVTESLTFSAITDTHCTLPPSVAMTITHGAPTSLTLNSSNSYHGKSDVTGVSEIKVTPSEFKATDIATGNPITCIPDFESYIPVVQGKTIKSQQKITYNKRIDCSYTITTDGKTTWSTPIVNLKDIISKEGDNLTINIKGQQFHDVWDNNGDFTTSPHFTPTGKDTDTSSVTIQGKLTKNGIPTMKIAIQSAVVPTVTGITVTSDDGGTTECIAK